MHGTNIQIEQYGSNHNKYFIVFEIDFAIDQKCCTSHSAMHELHTVTIF